MGWKQIVCITTLALLVATAAPTTAAQSTAAPLTAAPSTAAPATAAPTTAAPVTAAPTTAAPSTAAPSTATPATPAPSTAAPSTAAPPTAAPSTAAPSTAASVIAPLINYTCSMDRTITIKTNNLNATRIAIGQDKDESLVLAYPKNDLNHCKLAESAVGTQDIEMHGCNTDLPIYVYLMDQNSSNIVGGKNNHAYKLTCDFPAEGFQMVVSAAPISVNQTNAYPHQTHAFDLGDIGLTMTIKPHTPHLGDKLTLTISENNTDLYVLPMECTATGSNDAVEEQTLLTNGKAVDVNLLEDFNVTKKGSAVASMYAFRFQSSEVVRVTCNVTICKTMDCGGAYTPSPATRRRRSVEEAAAGRTYDVSAAFEILDNEPNESSSSSTLVRVNPLLTGLSLLCLWAVASSKTY